MNESTQQKPKLIAWFVGSRAHSGVEKKIRCPGTQICHAATRSSHAFSR